MTRTRATTPSGENLYERMIPSCLIGFSTSAAAPSINTITISPLQVFTRLTISSLGLYIGIAAGNVRLSLYYDNGDLPDGGTLITETPADTPAGAGKFEINLPAPIQLNTGLYWMACNFDNAAIRVGVNANQVGQNGTLIARQVSPYVFGAFPDPCPVTAATPANFPLIYAIVSGVP
jgi:hypothetical protein